MAERLGTGLQNLGQRFDSASHLRESGPSRPDLSVIGFESLFKADEGFT